jgi:hypothetical protein
MTAATNASDLFRIPNDQSDWAVLPRGVILTAGADVEGVS